MDLFFLFQVKVIKFLFKAVQITDNAALVEKVFLSAVATMAGTVLTVHCHLKKNARTEKTTIKVKSSFKLKIFIT